MPGSFTLDEHFESFVQRQLATGRYDNAREVLHDALRLMEHRERRLAALDAALARGLAEAAAGDTFPLDETCAAIDAELAALPPR